MKLYRYAFVIEYDGSFFSGWQRQDNLPSVQACLERALFSLTQEKVCMQGAGRTDAGVHAMGQVAHCDLSTSWPTFKLRQGMNFYLRDKGVIVAQVHAVDDAFHARFSATGRSYRYTIVNRSSPPLFSWGTSWWIPRPLCVQSMHAVCDLLRGTHDFSRFRHSDCQSASPVKTLDILHLIKSGDVITVHAQALSFLHRQVRLLVGALVQVGKGKWSVDGVRSLIADPLGLEKPPAAPARGLCLTKIFYDTFASGSGCES